MHQNEYKDCSLLEFYRESCLSFPDGFGFYDWHKDREIEKFVEDLELTDSKYEADREYAEYSRLRDAASFAEDRERYEACAPKYRPGYRYRLGFEFPAVYTQLDLF